MSSLLQDIHGKLSVCHMPGHAIVLIADLCLFSSSPHYRKGYHGHSSLCGFIGWNGAHAFHCPHPTFMYSVNCYSRYSWCIIALMGWLVFFPEVHCKVIDTQENSPTKGDC